MSDLSLRDMIEDIVFDETRYLRTYTGTVLANIDAFEPNKGVLQVIIPALGWITPQNAARCYPKGQINSTSVPNILEDVEVSFVQGDPSRPRWSGQDFESNLTLPKFAHNLLPTTHVIHESPILKQSIVVDDLLANIRIKPLLGLKVGLATEPMVRGTGLTAFLIAMVTQINAMVTGFNAHTHLSTAPGTPTGIPAASVPPIVQLPVTPPTGAEYNSLFNFLD